MSDMKTSAVPPGTAENLERLGVIAVLTIDDAGHAAKLATTLLENGIRGMELTLRTEAALDALQEIRRAVPDMFAGVGTLLNPAQVTAAVRHGACFGVSPGYNRAVVAAAAASGLPFAPGVATPSDIEGAYAQGCSILKYFHAEALGGAAYLQAINAPYEHLGLRYIPLGGIDVHHLKTYLSLRQVIAVGGSWIAPRKLILEENWSQIAEHARQAAAILRAVRGGP